MLATHLDRVSGQPRRLGQRHPRCGRGLACLGLGLGLWFGAGFGLGLGVFRVLNLEPYPGREPSGAEDWRSDGGRVTAAASETSPAQG